MKISDMVAARLGQSGAEKLSAIPAQTPVEKDRGLLAENEVLRKRLAATERELEKMREKSRERARRHKRVQRANKKAKEAKDVGT